MSAELNARNHLRQLIRSDAILHRSSTLEILDHFGRPMDWIFYSWGISLTHEGSSLAAKCLIHLLRDFESVQIAGIGMTGLPLASSIVSLSHGRYSALYVRPARERWGTQRRIEGVGDKTRPVVVVDDCICSGNSLKTACAALEAEGYRIEGAVCLVNFPWKGGIEWARAQGYRVETLFDSSVDFDESDRKAAAGRLEVAMDVDPDFVVPDGLSPSAVAKWVAKQYLANAISPIPPKTLDGQYDARGGVVVSFRDQSTNFRVGRDGFYHLNSSEADICKDIVLATIKTIQSSNDAIRTYGIDRLKAGVTLYSQQMPSTLAHLDFSRSGILIQSTAQPWRLEGALPNTQFFTSEIEQLRHARFTNAKLHLQEPYVLFTHTVSKSVEPGQNWPPFGTSAPPEGSEENENLGALIAARVRVALGAIANGREIPDDDSLNSIDDRLIDGVAVSLYHRGLIGCWVSWQSDLDSMVREGTLGAWNDTRWTRPMDLDPACIDLVISTLRLAEELGSVSVDRAAFTLRLGKDTLGVRKDKQHAILLSYIPCHNNWSKSEMAVKLLEKAGISQMPVEWTTYFTRSWLLRSDTVWPLESGYPRRLEAVRRPDAQVVRQLALYIADKFGASGLPEYCYYPTSDRAIVSDSAPRIVLAISALLEAGGLLADETLTKTALNGLKECCRHIADFNGVAGLDLPNMPCGVMAEAFLLNAIYRSRDKSLIALPQVHSLLSKFRSFFHSDGAITWLPEGMRIDSEHDLFPGAALLAMANVFEVEAKEEVLPFLQKHLDWYQRRFRTKPSWGMIFWQTQGWAAVHRVSEGRFGQEFVYELADWALDHQLIKNGAFLVDYAPDGPGFHTACVLEALADAWELARRVGDQERASRYRSAWEKGSDFLDSIIIREEDTFAMRQPHRAIGGIRGSLTSSSIRIDYVAHALLGFVKGPYVREPLQGS